MQVCPLILILKLSSVIKNVHSEHERFYMVLKIGEEKVLKHLKNSYTRCAQPEQKDAEPQRLGEILLSVLANIKTFMASSKILLTGNLFTDKR